MSRAAFVPWVVAALILTASWPASARDQEHVHPAPQAPVPPATAAPAPGEHAPAPERRPRPSFIPPITDDDRRAAFPDVMPHAVHDDAVNYFVLVDQLEWQAGDSASGVSWDSRGWMGKDRDRFWFRFEGDGDDGGIDTAQAHALYGRSIARWWDVVAGVRQDFRPGSPETWAAVGIQGLAPYWFEVEATAYVGGSGRTHVRLEAEYELLLTNRLVLQPLVEVEIYGKSDPERGIGAGLSTMESGLRLRYEFRRELAPFIGLVWHLAFGKTGDLAEVDGSRRGTTRLAAGFRTWF
jgi:copper resistance protein B